MHVSAERRTTLSRPHHAIGVSRLAMRLSGATQTNETGVGG
jgi:hypothetical protein